MRCLRPDLFRGFLDDLRRFLTRLAKKFLVAGGQDQDRVDNEWEPRMNDSENFYFFIRPMP
jgi:hypothetical protein